MFYFVRHGQTDYSERGTKVFQGFGVNLAPLSAVGVRQIEETAKDERLRGASLILSSPYTRAVQTAAILSKALQADIVIETDLHEWKADKTYRWPGEEAAEAAHQEYQACGGRYPDGEERPWETAAEVRERVLAVLRRYASYGDVVIACHGMMIEATTQGHHPENGEIVPFELD